MNKIGIIGAMDEEVAALKKNMTVTSTKTLASMEFFEGTLQGKDVVVVRSGIGKVNAAVCAEILAGIYNVDAIINTGIAGSLNSKINIGDIVISSDVLHHDMDATGFGYPLGQIPRMEVLSFTADKTLIDIAGKVCHQVNPEIETHVGRIVSGDQFISDKTVKAHIIENFQGFCTEMEGAAIAQTAYLNNIPFVILRAISDKADDSATEDYPSFEKKAIAHSVNLVNGILQNIN